ncbi:hypothetical protein V6N11_038296 [Hibiscus sabdariffa]|uniref:DUF4408 domain-containing protein n=1 Tax=Hibiscus sabdariffa TaxID=183260 RepID=A0ABR2SJV6_9ROSI
MKKQMKTQFSLHNTLHLFGGILFTCTLFFSNIPSLCSSMEHFLLTSLPCIWSSFSNPKCLFIVVNVIVIFLVGESRVVIGSNKSPVGGDVYDEYVEKSRSRVRRIEVSSNEDKGIDCKEDVIRCESESTEDVIRCESESKEERTCENVGEENGNEIVEDEQVVELPAEELNKRVEEFIARVNKQRMSSSKNIIKLLETVIGKLNKIKTMIAVNNDRMLRLHTDLKDVFAKTVETQADVKTSHDVDGFWEAIGYGLVVESAANGQAAIESAANGQAAIESASNGNENCKGNGKAAGTGSPGNGKVLVLI